MPEEWERKLRTLRRLEPAPHLLEKAKEGPRHPSAGSPLRSRVGTAIVAFGVFGAAIAFAWTAFAPRESTSTRVLGPGEIRRTRLSDAPQLIEVGEGAAWVVTGVTDTQAVVWRIDAENGAAKRLPSTRGAVAVAAGEGFVWVTSSVSEEGWNYSLLKLDPETGETIASIQLPPALSAPAIGFGAVWVNTRDGLTKVDPIRGQITEVFPDQYGQIDKANGSLWMTAGDAKVHRVDPETGRELASLDPFGDPCSLEVTGDSVWVATCGSPAGKPTATLTRIDTRSERITFQRPLNASGDIAVAGKTLWLAYWISDRPEEIRIEGLDINNGEPTAGKFAIHASHGRFDVGSFDGSLWTPSVAADNHSLWISEFYGGEVIRVGLPIQGSGPSPDTAPRQTPTSAPTPQPNSSPSAGDATRCELPTFQPTYLPWLKEGEPVPEPDVFHGPRDSATLYWSWPGSGTKYVRLARQSTTIGGSGPGERVAVEVAGEPFGELYEGEAPGDQLIYWNTGGATCSEFVLELSTNGDLSRDESKDTITRIAQSFKPKTPPSPSV